MKTVIVLCRPQSSLNVGAVCRVMANTDLDCLRIVGDKNTYNESEVLTVALHARKIWDEAQFFPATIEGLKAATLDCHSVFATTRRVGVKRKHQGITPEEFARLVMCEKRVGNDEKIAIVFGNERTGLTDEQILVCSSSINIPSSEKYGSYNLSHAVLIVAYTLFNVQKNLDESGVDDLVVDDGVMQRKSIIPLLKWKDRSAEGRNLMTFAENCEIAREIVLKLKEMGLYKKGGEKDCELFISQLLARAKVSKEEGEFFNNIFTKLCYETKKPSYNFVLQDGKPILDNL